jgi:CubicO group peptidase (beta-lactamase class C family)
MRYLLFFFLFIIASSHAQVKDQKARILQVENNLMPYVPVKGFPGWNITERMKYDNVPGLSIAVIKDYKIDWAKGYGVSDTIKKTPVTTTTMFSAGSISKLVMAVTALKLVQEGKIALDEPINHYLKSWKIPENDFTAKTPITLRMLLSHSAGTTQSSYFGFTPDKKPLPTVVEILSGSTAAESRPVIVNSEPGKEFRYSGGGSMIAQLALMDVSNSSFEGLTQKLVFDKLGMKYSTFEQPVPKRFESNTSWAYSSAPWFKGMPYVYPQQAAAGLYTTPTDLAKFFIEIQKSYIGKGEVLSESIAKRMLTPQVPVSDGGYKEEIAVGPFLMQRTDNKDPRGVYFEFTGVNAGFLAYGIASIEGGNGVIVMLNSGDDVNGIGKEIRRAVASAYNWVNYLPEPIQPVTLSESELDAFAGRYRRGADEVVYVRRENNYLVERVNEGNDIYCFPVSKDSVVFTDFNVKGGFARDANGDVISLQTVWQNEPMKKMRNDEFSPSEYLKQKRYTEAKEGFRQMKLNEYQLTYIAYDLLNKKSWDKDAVKAILELAQQEYPKSSIVFGRWGDYYLKLNDTTQAIDSYKSALELDPSDEQAKQQLNELLKTVPAN